MVRELFALPVAEWKAHLKANETLVDKSFFDSIDKRVRWGLENNHFDDAFRFAMLGDFAAEVRERPANYRIDLADLFYKAENFVLAGQIVDNILITTDPKMPVWSDAKMLRGKLFEAQRDFFNAYMSYQELAVKGFKPDKTWLKMAQVSLLVGEESRARAELAKAVEAGSVEAKGLLDELVQRDQDWSTLPPLESGSGDGVGVYVPTGDPLTDARLAMGAFRLADAADLYAGVFDPKNVQISSEYASVFYRMGDLVQARTVYDQALAEAPDSVDLLRGRGNAFERMYDREGLPANLAAAIADYQRALALAPDNRLIPWELARALSKQ